MRVYVVGAGAVGTFLGEALRATGADVAYAPRALEDVGATTADFAIVAVKSYATAGAIATLRAAFGVAMPVVVTVQNGVGNEELLADALGPDRIVSGALTIAVERSGDGSVVATNRGGGMVVASLGSDAHAQVAAAFARTAVPLGTCTDYRALKWSKLALNILANASCAILDVVPERMVKYDEVFAHEIAALREVRATMRALGLRPVDLPRYPVRALFAIAALPNAIARALLAQRIATARGRKPPSLLLDVRAGKGRTEIDVLNGAVARTAEELGLAAPVNATFAKLTDSVARDVDLRTTYRDNPTALVAALQIACER